MIKGKFRKIEYSVDKDNCVHVFIHTTQGLYWWAVLK